MASSESARYILQKSRLSAWIAYLRRGDLALYALISAFVCTTFLVATIRGDSILPNILEYADRVVRACLLLSSVLVLWICSSALVQGRRGSPVSLVAADLRRLIMSSMLARYLYACAILALFMAAFLYNKMMIPVVAPFQWDETFSRWDASLLGGHQAWQVIQPLVGVPWITLLLDLAYSLWVPMVFLFWGGLFASSRVPEPIRVRYWGATVISWLLIGVVMAAMFSSAGPCYFSEIVPGKPSPYLDLMHYLDEVAAAYPLSSSLTKELLWQVYIGNVDLFGGISAMPSMHNAQAALFAAVAYSISRRLGHVMLTYAVLIFLGSIHLGWHYAVDGIVGVVAALAVWLACGRLGQERRTALS
ncbi:phosphatase PAP2 family protein [Mesorhizobium sp. ES1-4]|uniref:phosphatase PAP2 family protein n=1 Tax=Mesorhizobium sp. ES1-4 TaxID=2876627 RepID=UPI001CCC36C3|nr:phosphatase PAP2 family protein [Mesorhizobium sp. ES1-4]MBZ9795471.1 phosphatase PAP2 family protein [Mesorhizobium sp. ES1-4]